MPPGVGAGIQGATDIVGLISSLQQQSAENQAINQTGDQLQQSLGQLGGEGSSLYKDFQTTAQPELASIIGTAPGAAAGYQGSASGAYGSEAGYGTSLGRSPYPGMIEGESGLFEGLPAGSIASQDSNAAALENWQGLGNKELGEATTVASDAAESAARTMKAQMGGVANPGAAFEQATNQAAQAGMQTGSQLGALAQEQELGAKEAAGQEYGQVAGEQLAQASGTVGATEAAGQAYQGAMEGAGGLEGAAGQGYAGLSQQELQELESSLSEEGTMGQAGLGAQEYGASDWTSLLENEMGDTQGQQNPYSQFGSSAASLIPQFAKGGGGGGSPASVGSAVGSFL